MKNPNQHFGDDEDDSSSRLIPVNVAVHKLGIERRELQRLIRKGEIQTFEGKLDLEELKVRFPQLALERDELCDRLELIRSTAFSRRVSSTVQPDTDELEIQIKKRDTELAVQRARADKYETILRDLLQMVCDLQETESKEQHETASFVSQWIMKRLND